jgi:protein TonB
VLLHGALVACGIGITLAPAVPSTAGHSNHADAAFVVNSPAPENSEDEDASESNPEVTPELAAKPPTPPELQPALTPNETPAVDVAAAAPLPLASAIALQPSKAARKMAGTRKAQGSQRGGTGVGQTAGGGSSYVPAQYDRCPAPPYPSLAKRDRLTGLVLVLVVVDESGRPSSVSLRRTSGHAVLDEAALAAVRRWKFIPARVDGQSTPATLEVPVRFVES